MLSKDLQSYDAPWSDASPVANPETEQAASSANRMAEDLAQATRTAPRAWLRFETTTSGAPTAANVIDSATVWGEGVGTAPTIEKTATGVYVATYAATIQDGLSALALPEGEEELVNFRFCSRPNVRGSTLGHAQATAASNVVTIYVFDAAGAASDLGGGVSVELGMR